MATGPQSFYSLWQEERIRETLFGMLSKEDICSVRRANRACSDLVTKRLFMRTHLTFTANTFTKASRVQALSHIAHHIEHLTFYLPHSEATFLPPLIHPQTGREISFLYTPHTCMASVLTRPKYANSELGNILTQQYPPLFHAATNVPSFLNAMKHLINLRHLTIKCPGQDPKERYRRNIVDYALISLRISVERAPLTKLSKLTLSGVHPAAFNYLRHVPGFGSHPSAARRWRQIRKLYMSVDTWDFYGPAPGLDHLKIIDDYVRNMAPHLEKLSFTWLGDNGSGVRKGPCPLALSADALFAARPDGAKAKKLFHELTGPMSPLPPAPVREPMQFPRLRRLTLRNATMNMPQLRDLVERHKDTVRQFDFESVSLTDGGSYEETFSQLLTQTSESGHNIWSSSRGRGAKCHRHGETQDSERSDEGRDNREGMPTFPSAHRQSFRLEAGSCLGTLSPPSSLSGMSGSDGAGVVSRDDADLCSPSAAVMAVSRELLDLDDESLESYLGLRSELPFMLGSPSSGRSASDDADPFARTSPPPPIEEVDEEEEEEEEEDGQLGKCGEDDRGLASERSAAHEDTTFTTHLKKRRVRHSSRHRRHESERGGNEPEADERRPRSRRHRHRHHHDRHYDKASEHHGSSSSSSRGNGERQGRETSKLRSHSRSRSQSSHRRHRGRKDAATPPLPPPPPLPQPLPDLSYAAGHDHPYAHRTPPPPQPPLAEILGQHRHGSDYSGDDDVFRPHMRGSETRSESPLAVSAAEEAYAFPEVAPLNISAPILAADPQPVVLQPTVYDPSAAVPGPSRLSPSPPTSLLSSPLSPDDGLSVLQRQILGQDEAHNQRRRIMAEDADARTSALKQAKATVLAKLSREFQRRMGVETAKMSAAAAAATTAATVAAAAASVSMSTEPSGSGGGSGSNWWGKNSGGHYAYSHQGGGSGSNGATAATLSLLAGLRLRGRLFGEPLSTAGTGMATADAANYSYYDQAHRSMESSSAVVPLIFSRA